MKKLPRWLKFMVVCIVCVLLIYLAVIFIQVIN